MRIPFFSVIIPTLNEEKYLPVLLKSLTKQTFRDFEVIVVDGQSKDKTVDVYKKFNPIIPASQLIIVDKRNAGYQRNIGAKQAKGLYLVFLDADCDIDPTFLEELHVSALKQQFSFATTWIKPDSKKTDDQLMMLFFNLMQELAKIVNWQFSGGYNTIVKRDVFLKLGGFREDMKINEDYDFALRAQKNTFEVTILKEPQVIFSLRRYRTYGTLPLLRKYALVQINHLLKGPFSENIFDYPMGGHVHNKKFKNKSSLRLRSGQAKFRSYIKKLDQLQKKLTQLFVE